MGLLNEFFFQKENITKDLNCCEQCALCPNVAQFGFNFSKTHPDSLNVNTKLLYQFKGPKRFMESHDKVATIFPQQDSCVKNYITAIYSNGNQSLAHRNNF